MPRFVAESVFAAPVERVFGFHEQPDALEKLSPRFPPARVASKSGGITTGSRVVLELGFPPLRQRWVALHTAYEKNRLFVDEQTAGPFKRWVHRHEFEAVPGGTRLRDAIEFELKGGSVMDLIAGWAVKIMLGRMFRFRHAVTRREVERR